MLRIACGALASGLLVIGCSASGVSTPTESPSAGASATLAPVATATDAPTPTPAPNQMAVSGRANIFGAGRERPPAPGGGGAGVLPPMWPLPSGPERIVTFPEISGLVNPVDGQAPENGPEGDRNGPTSVGSWEGISGIVHGENGMFLVGVFLTDDPPAAEAPERLDFTDGEDFDLLEPEIGQTFFIGDGVGRRFRAPDEATRLFLGFADAFLYRGQPGWYDNNSGQLTVTIEVIAVE